MAPSKQVHIYKAPFKQTFSKAPLTSRHCKQKSEWIALLD